MNSVFMGIGKHQGQREASLGAVGDDATITQSACEQIASERESSSMWKGVVYGVLGTFAVSLIYTEIVIHTAKR